MKMPRINLKDALTSVFRNEGFHGVLTSVKEMSVKGPVPGRKFNRCSS
jgi:hypothetical protein